MLFIKLILWIELIKCFSFLNILLATTLSPTQASSTNSGTSTTTTNDLGEKEKEGDDLVLIILLSVFIPLIVIALIVIIAIYMRNKRRPKDYNARGEIVDDMASIQGDPNMNFIMRNYGSTEPNMGSRVGSEESLGILDI